MNPRVSMVMAVYNGEKFLEESLQSLLAQTYTNFEMVVVDDASSDSTVGILDAFAKKDQRIRIIKNEQNLGLTKSLNKGVRASRGEYIARMDAGDTSESNRFSEQVTFLDQHPDHGLVGSWTTIIDEESKKIGEMVWEETDAEIRKALIKYNPIVHSSIMMRKNVFDQAGGYNENWKYAQDYELYFRMIKHAKVANMPLFLASYRMVPMSITRQKNKQQTLFALRARWKAIREGQFGWWTVIYLWRPILGYLLPYNVKKALKAFS